MLLLRNQNLVLLGALGIFLYYLTKDSTKKPSAEKPAEDEGDTDLTDVMNGNEPSSQADGVFTKEDLVDKLRPKKLESKSLGITLTYQQPYRGGARPTQEMIDRSDAWTVSGVTDEVKLKELGLNAKTRKGMRGDYTIAQTNDVIDFVFRDKENWSAKFGKPSIFAQKDAFSNVPNFSTTLPIDRPSKGRVPSLSEGKKEIGLIMRRS